MFLDNLKKNIKTITGTEYYCGFNFDDQKYQIIELKKKGNSYLPTYHKIFNSFDFVTTKGIFNTTNTLKYFKQIAQSTNTNIINISEIENKKLQENFIATLKIAGFKKVNVKKNNLEKILPLLVKTKNSFSNYSPDQQIFNAIFLDQKIYFILTKNGIIKNQKVINSDILEYDSIMEFLNTNPLDEQEVYISGDIALNLNSIKELFYIAGLKTHVVNIWQNINDTAKNIPNIFFLESHKYIKAITLTLPKLSPIIESTLPEKNVSEISKTESEKMKTTDNKFDLLSLSSFFKKHPKKIKKVEKKEKKEKKKIFLPKIKQKLFLPKKNKKVELKVLKATRVFYLEKIKPLSPLQKSTKKIKNNKEETAKKESWVKRLENFWDQKIF